MNPTVKKYLIVAAKQAVNAILTNAGLAAMLPSVFNLHNPAGMVAIAKAAGVAVVTREAMVWGPKLLAWSNSNGDQASLTK